MIFEKDKVYKVIHGDIFAPNLDRNYIIFSPLEDIDIEMDNYSIPIKTHFTVCFDKRIITKFDIRPSETGFDSFCRKSELHTKQDIIDIKNAIIKLGHGYKYNRKLNKLIEIKNDTEEGASI